jgi:N-formylglutamate amidohydrolase
LKNYNFNEPGEGINHSIIHVPHASKFIPDSCRDQFIISEKELNLEMEKLTDHFTDSLVEGLQAVKVVFPYSRLLVDVERFADDDLEPMSQLGMGVIYENGHKLKRIRRTLTADEKNKLLALYWNHHQRLEKCVDSALQKFNQCLIIDLHSYPKLKLPYERSEGERPELCIGTDSFHTPTRLIDDIMTAAGRLKIETALNTPFSGTLVPLKHYGKDQRVSSVMLEIRRDLYMDESAAILNTEKIKRIKSLLFYTSMSGTKGKAI